MPRSLALKLLGSIALMTLFGCAAKHGSTPPAGVSNVISAHHGACDEAARRRYGARIARLFNSPIPYQPYHCMSFTEATWLRGGCGKNDGVVFITFSRPQAARFVQDGHFATIRIRRLGVRWEAREKREMLLIDPRAFNFPAPPGARAYRGSELFAMFGVAGDPLELVNGECA